MKGSASPLRWMRAWVLGTTSVVLALLGHAAGGGHVEPSMVLLLVPAASVGSYCWLQRRRGPAAIVAAVILVQVGGHGLLSAGHAGVPDPAMTLAHLGAAVLLAVFLAWGEAQIFVHARRGYLRLLLASRLAAAGLRLPPPQPALNMPHAGEPRGVWLPAGIDDRGPPAGNCC